MHLVMTNPRISSPETPQQPRPAIPPGCVLRLAVIEKLPGMVYFARLILWRTTV